MRYGIAPPGHPTLAVRACGNGGFLANAGDDLHAVGWLAPLAEGYVGCVVIKPDGSRYLALAVPDPLAQ